MVRAQGGTEAAVRLGLFSRDFYRGQRGAARHRLRASSRRATSCRASPRPRSRPREPGSRCSRGSASTCAGSAPTSSTRRNPAMAPGQTLGGSYAAGDGYIDPPRNVLAYTTALVRQRGRRAASGRRVHRPADPDGDRVTGVADDRGDTATGSRWCSPAGRPWPRSARRPAPTGSRPAAPGTRSWSPSRTRTSRPTGCRWSSTSASGIYWRPEEGGLLWGMSNPDEQPGEAAEFD